MPAVPAKELEARRLFYAAEVESRRMETFGAALEKYRTLLGDYADTRLVQLDTPHIARRSEGGKEYLLLTGDIKGNGAVRLGAHPELKSCWTCQEDVGHDRSKARETYVEIEFWALPQTGYLCWIFAGACCEETFTTYMQGTDMTGPNPKKSSEKVPYDVGGAFAALVEPKVKGLKRTHAQHGGEKQASRWEWIQIPLPKYPAGGLKKVRLMTENKGFSVGMALVSSVRKAPPRGEELKEELIRALAERPPLPSPAEDAPSDGRPAPSGRVVFSENFDSGTGRFNGGTSAEGGVRGTKALAVPPKGADLWGVFQVTVKETTAIRFKIKPPAGITSVSVNIWSDRLNENLRYHVRGLKPDEWKQVEFRLLDMRARWDMSGPPPEAGDIVKSFKLYYTGPEEARILMDDFEVRE